MRPPHIPVVYQHQDFVVVNKPSGVGMHAISQSDSDHENFAILDVLQTQLGHRFHLCHRLDTPTSGCLLLAKNPKSAALIGKLFETRKIQKYYIALSDGKAKKKQGSIIGDMQKARNGAYKLTKTRNHPAITQFVSSSVGKGLRAYLCKPLSGKTHQIRVALKSISAPILGDKRYKGTDAQRLHLHSYALKFDYNGELIEIVCSPPDDMLSNSALQALPNTWRQPWQLDWPRQPAKARRLEGAKQNYRVGIVGHGAIGQGLAKLFDLKNQANIDYVFLTRDDKHHAIEKSIPLNASGIADGLAFAKLDALIIPVKYYSLDDLITSLSKLASHTDIILLQNGFGGHKKLIKAFPDNRIYAGSTTDAIVKQENGRIRVNARGELRIGMVHAGRGELPLSGHAPVNAILNAHPSGIWDDNVELSLYRKLAVNAVINPLCAKYRCRNGEIRAYHNEIEAVKAEVFSVYSALCLALDLDKLSEHIDDVIELTKDNYCSMYQDLYSTQNAKQSNGDKCARQTEIDGILGTIIKIAHEKHISLPIIEQLYAYIHSITSKA
ncbi:TIGR01621 family pseudouridine synthase [Ningiella sp. W23]|uniref:TIGR01621 family pseudouridine synthase n=1 Tax=Ningiella sp. W23 TaxID=3023715 RepID=UPI003756E65A